ITNGTENSVVLLTSTEKSGQPWLLLLLHYHENTTLIWKTYFGTAPKQLGMVPRNSELRFVTELKGGGSVEVIDPAVNGVRVTFPPTSSGRGGRPPNPSESGSAGRRKQQGR